jgi:alpha-ketoglutarate-dependent taurine dioxygenase
VYLLVMTSPYTLDNPDTYQRWRQQKLQNYPTDIQQLVISVKDATSLSLPEQQAIFSLINKTNMAIISAPNEVTSQTVTQLGSQVGLQHLDANIYSNAEAVTALSVQNKPSRQQAFIPYTNKPIAWHTDGYYNPLNKQVLGMLLYCASPAATGGMNHFIDPEIAYIHIRDTNPEFIRALFHPNAMLIPAHENDGVTLRPAQGGPVFSTINGQLHMRYTHRKKSIEWHDSAILKSALACLHELFADGHPSQFQGTLASGQALLCNNVLHNRTGFTETGEQTRLMFRGRYFDRVSSHAIS